MVNGRKKIKEWYDAHFLHCHCSFQRCFQWGRGRASWDLAPFAISVLWILKAACSESGFGPNQFRVSLITPMPVILQTGSDISRAGCCFVVLETVVFALLETSRKAVRLKNKISILLILVAVLKVLSFFGFVRPSSPKQTLTVRDSRGKLKHASVILLRCYYKPFTVESPFWQSIL